VDAAKDQLDYTNLRAPFDGTVVAKYAENYEDVKAKQPIVRLVDASQIEMIVNIPETMISYVDDVDEVIVTFDTFPNLEIPANIKEVGKEASQTTRTYPVTLIMDQPKDTKILPGMAGKVKAKGESQKKIEKQEFEIPVTAVFSPDDSGRSYVWVIDESSKKAQKREVKTGMLTDFGVKVIDGLKPGEWVATAGVHYLREGQQVKILAGQSKEVPE
jgi:RND family efflux transporter MFP subunit